MDDNGVTSGFGAVTWSCTGAVFSEDVFVATSTDTLVDAGSATAPVLGCDEVVVSASWLLSVASRPDAMLAGRRFGFFGAVVALDLSEPDFLSFGVALVVDLPPLVSPDFLVSAAPPPLSPLAPAPWSPDGDADEGVEESAADDDEEDVSVDGLVDPESVGPAHATPGVVATATPTPKATAKPPTRPTYVAYPITTPPGTDAKGS
ncbi:hypothetical protein GGC64_000313 [Mycobacterium sp. OAS707]|uniref:hypothetical protein n=1 Tax=Mycobacterium sp. OAS707 TaxID=2663822 RepID=UPI00178A9DB7|nr:hypothetical protein [Mycobacterium sp. OAS707]MBE1546305.1 hypothetical protein [Mycobacterium sp. OAS707]